MPVSLPEGEAGVSVSFRTISLPFEAIRAEYLSRTQWLRKLVPWPKTYDRYVRVASRNRTLAHIRRFEKMADEVARPKIIFTGLPEGYQTSCWAEDFGIFIICFIATKKDEPKCPLLPI